MLKAAVIILAVVLAYAGIFSLVNIIRPRTMMGSVFETMTGKAFEEIRDSDYLRKLENGQRIMGVFGLLIATAGTLALCLGFRRTRRWAWWAFLFTGVFAWLWALVYQIWGLIFEGIITSIKSSILFQSIAMILLIVGLFLPFRLFFAKAPKSEKEEE